MEFHSNVLVNFTSIIATIIAATIALVIVVHRLKRRWRIRINCWFCNVNTKIYRSEIDWWRCPSCSQYNGFTKDGDYNYDIPEQRNKTLNNLPKLYSSPHKNPISKTKNGLCDNCNRNEELKLYELRSIDPTMWDETEIQVFRDNLEKKYPMCKKCNSFVKRILQKQAAWLTQYKMLLFKQRYIKIIVDNGAKFEKLCRLFLTFLSASIIYYPTNQSLPICGAILQLITVTRVPICKRSFDLLLTLVWVGIGMLMPIHNMGILKPKLKLFGLTLEYITGHQMIIVLSSIMGFVNVTTRNASTSNPNISFKRLDSSLTHPPIPEIPQEKENSDVKPEIQSARRSPVNVTHLLTTPSAFAAPAPIKSTMISPNFRICNSQNSSLFTSSSNINNSIDIDQVSPKRSPSQIDQSERYVLNDSLKTLSSLSLSEKNQIQPSKTSKIFETRTYGTTSPDLFRRNYKSTGRKFILAPPKLKNVSQTSWVAGGYWQTGMEPSLSRSSSQSSGFGSAGSNFGPSREPSVVNDVDHCSVVSEPPTQCCLQQRQPSVSPVNSFCQHGSSYQGAAHKFNGCSRSPVTNMMVTSSCSEKTPASICHSYHISDQCLQSRNMNFNMIQRSPQVPQSPTYPTTVFASPTWLPALLCGSLIFNMIVFCTVLLR